MASLQDQWIVVTLNKNLLEYTISIIAQHHCQQHHRHSSLVTALASSAEASLAEVSLVSSPSSQVELIARITLSETTNILILIVGVREKGTLIVVVQRKGNRGHMGTFFKFILLAMNAATLLQTVLPQWKKYLLHG